jgi:hypothetical protein
VDVVPVLRTLIDHGCRFVVIGSAARQLAGEAIAPHDLDIIVSADPSDRPRLRDALIELGATTRHGLERHRISRTTGLPWDWGWNASTPFGDVDVIVRLIDDTTIIEHNDAAVDCSLPDGSIVRCHPTRFAA